MFHKLKNQRGFTIIELLIATTIFSVVLMILMAAILQIGRIYQKSSSMARTQEATRSVVDDVSRALQFSPAPVSTHLTNPSDSSARGICIGARRYSYVLGRMQDRDNTTQQSLVSDLVGGTCTSARNMSAGALGANEKELLSDRMRIVKMDIQPASSGSTTTYRLTVRMIYGPSDLICDSQQVNPNQPDHCFNGADWTEAAIRARAVAQSSAAGSATVVPSTIQCKTVGNGSEFCAVSELSTIVERRLK